MGQLRFLTPRHDIVPEGAVERAYMAGMEGIPWRSTNSWDGKTLVVDRPVADSGNLFIAWPVHGRGNLVLCTPSLMEREKAYHLDVELARGTLNRVRNQAADWQVLGLNVSDEFRGIVTQASQHFTLAATSQQDLMAAAEHAARSLEYSTAAAEKLGVEYTEQALSFRHHSEPQLSTLLAVNVGTRPLEAETSAVLSGAFNTASVPFCWRDLESRDGEYNWEALDQQVAASRNNGWKVCSGPLLRLDKASLPDWIYLWEDDFDDVKGYALRYVEAAVARYQGKIQLWNCAGRLNRTGDLAMSEEQRLRMAVSTIETVRRVDPRTPVIMSFDQPWAEYLAREDNELSPIHFADALARADLGVAGVGLEINLAYWPMGTLPRDLLDISRQIDRWSMLGLPLLVLLTYPGGEGDDPNARPLIRPTSDLPGGMSVDAQRTVVEQLVRILLAKKTVHGLIWNQLTDADPHEFPHGGLFDVNNSPKPLIGAIEAIRKSHLK